MRRFVLASVPACFALLFGLACAESTSDGFGGGDEGGAGQGGTSTTQSTTTTTSSTTSSTTTSTSTTATTTTATTSSTTAATTSSSTTTGGGTCDPLACVQMCLEQLGIGECVGNTCVCEPLIPSGGGSLIGSSGSFFIAEPGQGGASGESGFEYDGFEPAE